MMKKIDVVKGKYSACRDNEVLYQAVSNFVLDVYDEIKMSIETRTDFTKTTIEECNYGELSEINADIYRKTKRYFEGEEQDVCNQ